MIITISSPNKELFSLLNKNPTSSLGVYTRQARNGQVIGYINGDNYYAFFHDTKHSFTKYEDNQLDFKSFCDPECGMVIINNLFKDILADKEVFLNKQISWLGKAYKEVDTEPCHINVKSIYIDSSWVKSNGEFLLTKYFPVTITKKGMNLYSMDVNTNSVFKAINVLSAVFFLTATSNSSEFFTSKELTRKYCRVLSNSEAPYFMFYILKRKCLASRSLFDELKPVMEAACKNIGQKVEFTPNDTQVDRIFFAKDHINFDKPVLFYGCGEFSYEKMLRNHFKNSVVSYDIEDYSEYHEKCKMRFPVLRDWEFTINEPDFSRFGSIVISEVLEHNTQEEAANIIQKIMAEKSPDCNVIITMPNRDFNQYYCIEKRREDHIFEPNKEEVVDLIPRGSTFMITQVGDVVNKESVSFGIILG